MDLILQILRATIGDAAPEWFQVIPAGEVLIEGEKPAIMDKASAALVMRHFEGMMHDMVIDYEHQTLSGQKAPAAGWIKALEWREGDGLWAKSEWTAEAAEYIKNKEYRYFSPVFFVRKSDRKVVELYNVALTNQPRMMNIRALAAKYTIDNQKKGGNIMIEKLKKLLGLADDAAEETVVEKVEAVVNKNTELQKAIDEKPPEVVACKEVLDVLKLDDTADKVAVVAAISGLGVTGNVAKELSLEVAKLRREISDIKQQDLVAEALKNGQTSAEELDKWGRDLALKSPEQFRLIVLARPKGSVVPIEKIGEPPAKKGDLPDDVQLEINKQMGIDDETWKKYGPKSA